MSKTDDCTVGTSQKSTLRTCERDATLELSRVRETNATSATEVVRMITEISSEAAST